MGSSIAIVGGGIAGLAAAQHLAGRGIAATVYETANRVGGRMASEQIDGFVIDTGAYTFPESHRKLGRCLAEGGPQSEMYETAGTAATILEGRAHRIKIGSATGLLGYRLLGILDKIYLASLFARATLLGAALELYQPNEKIRALERENIAEFLHRANRADVLERIAVPICSELFLGSPEGNSSAALLATLGNLLTFRISAMDRGMGQITDWMAADLDVRCGTAVTSVVHDSPGHDVRVLTAGGENHHAGAIVAVPAPLVPGLVPDLAAPLSNYLSGVVYAPALVVALALDSPPPAIAFITSLLRAEFKTIATVVRDDLKAPGRVPAGAGLVTVILREPAARQLFDTSDEAIMRAVLGDLYRAFPDHRWNIRFARVHRWRHGAVQLRPGHFASQIESRNHLSAGHGSIEFAGDGLHFSGAEAAFRSGIAAAERLTAKLAVTVRKHPN